jgi:hypothetical protein
LQLIFKTSNQPQSFLDFFKLEQYFSQIFARSAQAKARLDKGSNFCIFKRNACARFVPLIGN